MPLVGSPKQYKLIFLIDLNLEYLKRKEEEKKMDLFGWLGREPKNENVIENWKKGETKWENKEEKKSLLFKQITLEPKAVETETDSKSDVDDNHFNPPMMWW